MAGPSSESSSGLWGFPTSVCNHPGCTSIHGPGFDSTPASTAEFSQPSTAHCPPLPANDNNALHSMIKTLQARLQATINVNAHLAATVAHLQAEQAISAFIPTTPTPTPTTTATDTTDTTAIPAQAPSTIPAQAPSTTPCLHPGHPCTIASGRGAASPEVFNKMIKTNWHGRLGRTHMVDVDALSPAALVELDCLLRRKLRPMFPRGGAYSRPDADAFFTSLASLGLRLEDRGNYADVPDTPANQLYNAPMTRRGEDLAAWYNTGGDYGRYWKGVAVETMMELARYRGLFDEEGFLIQ